MAHGITDKNIRFTSEIHSLEKVNPLFSRAIIKGFYHGGNRNGSFISKETAERAIPSLYNIPIVGEFLEETNNFGDHGESKETKDGETMYRSSTIPFGVVPESAKIYWEEIVEKDGRTKEYLVVDGAYLWTGRYEHLSMLSEQEYGQSMEIEVVNGQFAVKDGVNFFEVDDFIFSAFCILGIDKDGGGKVEPCFESASIASYSLDKEGFKKEFMQMVDELKFSLKQGGNEEMSENKTNEEEVKVTEVVEEDVKVEENSTEDIVGATKISETAEETETEKVVVEEDQKEEDDSKAPQEPTSDTEQVEDDSSKEDTEDVTDDAEKADEQSEQEEQVDATDYESKFNESAAELDKLKSDYSTLEAELTEFKIYKRGREELDLKAKFEGKLSEEEFNTLFQNSVDQSIEEIEEKLFAMIGKKTYSVNKVEVAPSTSVKIAEKNNEPMSPFDALFAAYSEEK